ncbi:glucose-6-phosphate isomerase [bacterium]|nr:MAG: glucose-6-phosphate isomerase [bacterium]
MIKVHTHEAKTFVADEVIVSSLEASKKSFEQLKSKTGKGAEWLGWNDLVANPDDALLSEIDDLAASIRANADVFIVVGIGGSYLGAKAVIDALIDSRGSKKVEILYAGHHMSGTYLTRLIDYISKPKADGSKKSVYMNVISKSGTTIEPALAFRFLRDWMNSTYGVADAKKRISCTTSPNGGALNKIIEANGYKKFIIPDNVGGRFSVFTPVGLLPIAVAGIDVKSFFYGAVSSYKAIQSNSETLIDYTATRFALYKTGYKIDVIASFEPELLGIGGWLQQLLGESEGKEHNGLYPAVHGYSTDLHSLGQMVQDGERNLFETFITVKTPAKQLVVKSDEDNYDGLNFVAGKTMHEINSMGFLGTKEAHLEGGVPVITIELDRISPEEIGASLYFFELSCGVYVYNIGVNPFDQPGVEAYKKAMYRLLGK